MFNAKQKWYSCEKTMSIIVWKPIPDFEDYIINNYGDIKGKRTGKLLSPSKLRYSHVTLFKEKRHYKSVHRLVAETFLPNPDKLPCVNHKDENIYNNFVWINPDGSVNFEKSNLEWCSVAYNNAFGTRPDRVSKTQINDKTKSKPVFQRTLQGVLVATHPSLKEAERQTGINAINIGRCCRGKVKTAGGYIWEYASN